MLRTGYEALLEPHALEHAALFDRVTLDLGGSADRRKTTEELLYLAKTKNCLPPTLTEKMYDAGRYMLICSAGELLPEPAGYLDRLVGTGLGPGISPFNTNVQAAMAAACSGNLTELMEGYFRLMESFYPEWRLNANRIYGCRGVLTNTRASNTALDAPLGKMAGRLLGRRLRSAARISSRDYADYTETRTFLEKRCVPLLRDAPASTKISSPNRQDGCVSVSCPHTIPKPVAASTRRWT